MKRAVTQFISLIVFFSFLASSTAQERKNEIKQLTKDVEYLASDKLKGREAGTKQEKTAAEYIAKRFESIGLTPLGEKDGDKITYFQSVDFPKSKDPHTGEESEERLSGINVVGYLDNGGRNNVTIGAHFDHLGMGGENSFDETEGIHNGADDNASGVALLTHLAERLKSSKYKRNNYIIIAFTGEEKGLYGSNYFLKHPPFFLNVMNYMINLDMVGRYDPEKGLVINGVGTSPIWISTLEKANTMNLKYKVTESGIGRSDQTSFYLKDVPAIHFFTGSHEDYHRSTDDADKINYEGMLIVSDYVFNVIGELNTKLKLAFTRTKDEDESNAPRYKVSLGVIPDYLFEGPGMRIEGVKQDRPGSNAGLLAGDIVVKMGEVDVKNMKSYMEGLSKLEEGQKAKVIVLRGEEELEFEVQF